MSQGGDGAEVLHEAGGEAETVSHTGPVSPAVHALDGQGGGGEQAAAVIAGRDAGGEGGDGGGEGLDMPALQTAADAAVRMRFAAGVWTEVNLFDLTKGNTLKDPNDKGSIFCKSIGDDGHARGLAEHVAYSGGDVATGLTCDGTLFIKWIILKTIFLLDDMQAIYSQNAPGSGKKTQVLVLPAIVDYDKQLSD